MGYTFFYLEANIVCIIIFAILLFKNIYSVDRQEKQLIFDKVLISSMMYFACDSAWALFTSDALHVASIFIDIVNLGNSVILAFMCYFWFLYVEVSQGAEYINLRRNRLYTMVLALVSSLVMLIMFVFFRRAVVDEYSNLTNAYYVIFLTAPLVYILAAAGASFVRASYKTNFALRTQYIHSAVYPIGVSISGVVQTLFINAPMFCFGCTIMMIYTYIMSLDNMVSLDPLTNLNNRAQLKRYISNDVRPSDSGDKVIIFMIDLNKFKSINDNYGHLEGDKAIVRAAEAIRNACSSEKSRPFIARYGGDEFIVVAKMRSLEEADGLKVRIKKEMVEHNDQAGAVYELNASVGFSEYSGRIEDFQNALNTADDALYDDKHNISSDEHECKAV